MPSIIACVEMSRAMRAGRIVRDMLLAIDVGNTQTVLGIYQGERLAHMWRVATNKAHTGDELRLKLCGLMQAEGLSRDMIRGVALASVVPALTLRWQDASRAEFGREPYVCTASTAGSLFRTNYANPAEIGADRVADAVAAQALYGTPVVVVDFGTATNIEVVDENGMFAGGIIAPGLETGANALFSHASRLAAIDLVDPRTAIGGSTEQAVQAGIVYGEADRVDGLVRRVFAQLGYEATVVATGGLASRVAPLSSTIDRVDPELTLQGLRMLFESHEDTVER